MVTLDQQGKTLTIAGQHGGDYLLIALLIA
jgi:hypothetical protein